MKVLFYLSRKKRNKKRECPVYCRITINGQRAEFSTGIFILPDNWRKGKIKGVPAADANNNFLESTRVNLVAIETSLRVMKTDFNCRSVINIHWGKSPVADFKLISWYRKMIEQKRVSRLPQSIRAYESRYKLAREFFRDKMLSEVTAAAVDSFKGFLEGKGYGINYISKQLQTLRQFLGVAVRQGIITANPMENYPLLWRYAAPVTLSAAEIAALESSRFAAPRLDLVRDLFLMQVYTGLSYADLMRFNGGMLSGEVIYMQRQKSETRAIIPLRNQARRLFDKYSWKIPQITNQKYNAYLKEIGEITGINKRLTTHVARKTCGQLLLDRGVSMEVVSAMLGHTDIKTTQQFYARVSEERILRELKKAG